MYAGLLTLWQKAGAVNSEMRPTFALCLHRDKPCRVLLVRDFM